MGVAARTRLFQFLGALAIVCPIATGGLIERFTHPHTLEFQAAYVPSLFALWTVGFFAGGFAALACAGAQRWVFAVAASINLVFGAGYLLLMGLVSH